MGNDSGLFGSEVVNEWLIVCDEEDGIAQLMDSEEKISDHKTTQIIEISGGFICDYKWWVVHERSGDGDFLSFASREFLDEGVGSLLKFDESDKMFVSSFDIFVVVAVDFQRVHDIVADGEIADEFGVLEDDTDLSSVFLELVCGHFGDIFVAVVDALGRCAEVACEHVDESTFSSTWSALQDHKISLPDREVKTLE